MKSNVRVKLSRKGGKIRIALDNVQMFQRDLFSTVLFDKTAGAEEVAERLPEILTEFEKTHHAKITNITPFSPCSNMAFLLQHTAPQDIRDGPLM